MTYGEKLLYISVMDAVLKEPDPVKQSLYYDELISLSAKGGVTRETDLLERLRDNKDGLRDNALKKGCGGLLREIFSTDYERKIRKTASENLRFRVFDDYTVVDDVIIMYSGKAGKVTVPASFPGVSIRRIGAGAFYGNKYLREVTVSDGIREVGKAAFSECIQLKNVDLANSAESIHPDAFKWDSGLCSVRFGKEISKEVYDEIIRNEIELNDGRFIIDPMVMGNHFARWIRGSFPGLIPARFNVYADMGCLFELPAGKPDEIGLPDPIPLTFKRYIEDHNGEDHCLKDEGSVFVLMLKNDDYDPVFEHDEEADDLGSVKNEACEITGMLFINDLSMEVTKKIQARFEVRAGTYFFQRGRKVKYDGKTYYLYFREVLSADNKRPYVRMPKFIKVFSEITPGIMHEVSCDEVSTLFDLISGMV